MDSGHWERERIWMYVANELCHSWSNDWKATFYTVPIESVPE